MSSDTGAIALPPICHIGVLVRDIDETTQFLSSVWSLGPWHTYDVLLNKDDLMVGEPFSLKVALAKIGPMELELIQPLDGRGFHYQTLETRGEGLHHIAFNVPNWEEMASKLREKGGVLLAGGIFAGIRWGYFETKPGGIIVEFEEQLEGKPLFTLPDNTTATLPPPRHIGAVVKDADKTTKFLSSMWGLGPWDTMDVSIDKENIIVGEPCRLKEAHTRLGPVVLELIQPLKGRGPWSEFLETKGEGLQHVAFSVSNYDEMVSKVLKQGGRMVVDEIYEGVRGCYLETKPGAILIELAEPGIHDEQEKNLNP